MNASCENISYVICRVWRGRDRGGGGELVASQDPREGCRHADSGRGGGRAAAGAGAGRVSRAHCKSSGYESIGLDSESTSVDSYTGTLADTR